MDLKASGRVAALGALGLCSAACASVSTVHQGMPKDYEGPKTASGLSINGQLRQAAGLANHDAVFMVGSCQDDTGKYGDPLSPYSRVVTQACGQFMYTVLTTAGFPVVERDPRNLSLIAQEYEMGHKFAPSPPRGPGDPPAPPQNVGLVQRGGPNGGLTGARYMFTGSITSYDTSVQNGGGGVDVDAIGYSTRSSEAKVGISIRLVDVSTGLVVSSLLLTTEVVGTTTDYHITRIIGDVTNTIATIAGGVGATTVTRPDIDNHIVSAEFGRAQSLPVNYAVVDAVTVGMTRLLEVNQSLFYTDHVQFNYDLPKG